MTPTVESEREALLPRIEHDQRELASAVNDLESTAAEVFRRVAYWSAAALALLIVSRFVVRRLLPR